LTTVDWQLDELTEEYGLTVDDKVHLESIIWVGASTADDKRWGARNHVRNCGSNYGSRIDLFAPGDAIKSATATSTTSIAIHPGTSFVSHDKKGTLITTDSPQLYHTLRRLPTLLESSHVCSATLVLRTLTQRR